MTTATSVTDRRTLGRRAPGGRPARGIELVSRRPLVAGPIEA